MFITTLFVLCAAVFGVCAGEPAARLVGGSELQNMGSFPHHVVISSLRPGHKCGGSILNANWVLTSAACVKNRALLNLYFGKTNIKSHIGNFLGTTVKKEHIQVLDSLALIRVDKTIQFSEAITPIPLSKASADSLSNRFAVMPGFSDGKLTTLSSGNLRYGMFTIQEVNECIRAVGRGQFSDDSRLCTKGWGDNMNSPCDSDVGSGLVVGWPNWSELVGVFSESDCDPTLPGVYIHLGKYLSWIEDTINE